MISELGMKIKYYRIGYNEILEHSTILFLCIKNYLVNILMHILYPNSPWPQTFLSKIISWRICFWKKFLWHINHGMVILGRKTYRKTVHEQYIYNIFRSNTFFTWAWRQTHSCAWTISYIGIFPQRILVNWVTIWYVIYKSSLFS